MVFPIAVGIVLLYSSAFIQRLMDMEFGHSPLARRLGWPPLRGWMRLFLWLPWDDPVLFVFALLKVALEIFVTRTALIGTGCGGHLLVLL